MLVNNQYVRQGEVVIRELFYFEDVGEHVRAFIVKVPVLTQIPFNL